MLDQNKFINRELSWLSFNERVLQEAEDKTVPLIERVKFLGIFSSNLDEFFRVRVASIKRMREISDNLKKEYDFDPDFIFSEIQKKVIKLRKRFDKIYDKIQNQLRKEQIYVINEEELTESQTSFVRDYFAEEVISTLSPIMLSSVKKFPTLKNDWIYLVTRMVRSDSSEMDHALIELPTDILPRFIVIPSENGKTCIIRLDDIIRFNLKNVFMTFNYASIEAFTLKVTLDAELDFDNDEFGDMPKAISKSLKKRKIASPVRMTIDHNMPPDVIKFLKKKLNIQTKDHINSGGRYHNNRDLIKFPKVGRDDLKYKSDQALLHKDFIGRRSYLELLTEKDIMLHYPYQSFNYFIDLLREASIDPDVKRIKMTVYRVAEKSNVIKALINAARNGKEVTVVVELRARFDEENNLAWSQILSEEGIRVFYGYDDKKIHSKLCLIEKVNDKESSYFSFIGTGNFNEDTADLYCDDILLTSNKEVGLDLVNIFKFMEKQVEPTKLKHLIASPLMMKDHFLNLIDEEIKHVKKGRTGKIIIKVNNLMDLKMVNKLYEASEAGVEIDLIIRSTCALIPKIKNLSESVNAISIIDKYLEHSRVIYFYNDGDEKMYITSADWMTRNLDRRVEMAMPIYSEELRDDLKKILDIQLKDNVKARELNKSMNNNYKSSKLDVPIRAQVETYYYFKNKVDSFIK